MMEYQYFVKRAVGDLWMDTNAQLSDVSMVDALSTPGLMLAKIPAGLDGGWHAEDNRQVYGRWDTIVIAESEDHLHHWGGVCINAAPSDTGGIDLTFLGCTGWWKRLPYLRQYQTWKKDVARVLDDLFADAMADAPSTLPIVLNTPAGGLGRTVGDNNPPPEPVEPVRDAGQTMDEWEARDDVKAYKAARDAWNNEHSDSAPYSLAWWEAPFFGEEVDSLRVEAEFEYRERTFWADRNKLDFRMAVDIEADIRVRRHDIKFEDGVNIALPLKVRDDEQVFANHVIGLGAGEGRDMVRAESRASNNRLYQAEYVSAKDVRDANRLKALTEAHVGMFSSGVAQVDEVTVWDTPGYASMATLRPGDEVFVESRFTQPHVNIWRRVTRIERRPSSNQITIGLERANG